MPAITLNSSNPRTDPARCAHRFPAGRRCAQPPCPSHPSFCFTHIPQPVSLEQSIAQELAAASASLSSPEDLNRVLCKLIQAIIHDHISIKKAASLGFLAQTILQTHREIFLREKYDHQRQLEEDDRNSPRLCAWADHLEQNIVEPPPANPHPESPANSPTTSPAAPSMDAPLPPLPTSPLNSKNPEKILETPPPSPVDLNHFYPWDPTLPPGRQDPNRKLSPPPQPAFSSNARPANRGRRAWFP